MHVIFRDPPSPDLQHPQPVTNPPASNPPPSPDYAALVTALLDHLGVFPDGAGELMLSAEESAVIRRTGWSARAGLWRCPAIPWESVRLYPGLWHLSDHLDSAWRSMPWHPRRAVFHRPGMIDPLGSVDHQLLDQLRAAPGTRLTARQLRHRVS